MHESEVTVQLDFVTAELKIYFISFDFTHGIENNGMTFYWSPSIKMLIYAVCL